MCPSREAHRRDVERKLDDANLVCQTGMRQSEWHRHNSSRARTRVAVQERQLGARRSPDRLGVLFVARALTIVLRARSEDVAAERDHPVRACSDVNRTRRRRCDTRTRGQNELCCSLQLHRSAQQDMHTSAPGSRHERMRRPAPRSHSDSVCVGRPSGSGSNTAQQKRRESAARVKCSAMADCARARRGERNANSHNAWQGVSNNIRAQANERGLRTVRTPAMLRSRPESRSYTRRPSALWSTHIPNEQLT